MKNFFLFFPLTAGVRNIGMAFLAAMALVLTGCGGGGSDGDGDGDGGGGGTVSEQAFTVTDEQSAEDSSVAARESARQAIVEEESSGGSIPFGVEVSSVSLHDKVMELSQLSVLQKFTPEGVTGASTTEGPCGGTQEVVIDEVSYESGSVIFNDYCMVIDGSGSNSVIDGRIDVDFESSSDFTRYTTTYDYTITYLGETTRYTGTQSCDESGCTTETDFEVDGRTYRSEGVVVTSTGSSYSVSGRVYDGDRGYVDYEASNLVLCSDGGFQSGSISITDSSGSVVVEVTFDSCSSYTVTYDGVSRTVSY